MSKRGNEEEPEHQAKKPKSSSPSCEGTQHTQTNLQTIPSLQDLKKTGHGEILVLFKEQDVILPEYLGAIAKKINDHDDGLYPLDALRGSHLYYSITKYNNTYKDTGRITIAEEEMIKILMESVGIIDAARLIADWLFNTYIKTTGGAPIKLEHFCKYNRRMDEYLLIVKESLYFPFNTNLRLVHQISEAFSNLLLAKDKQEVTIPFMACAPGSGKSRTLQEIFQHTKQGVEFGENCCKILISFGNGTRLRENELLDNNGYEMALCGRMLYSYLDIPDMVTYEHFFEKVWKYVEPCLFADVVQWIANFHRQCSQKILQHDPVYVYLAIDEFTNLSFHKLSNVNGDDRRTFLDGVINLIGSYITSHRHSSIHLLPFFAGLDYRMFVTTIARSNFSCTHIFPYKFDELDEISIVEQYFPTLRYSCQLWKVLGFCNRHPRILVWLIMKYRESKNIKEAYTNTEILFRTTYKIDLIPKKAAKWILAHVITQTKVHGDTTVEGDWTVQKLEENGWISLHKTKEEAYYTISAPLAVLFGCCGKSESQQELFLTFLTKLKNSAWKQETDSKSFEKFNGYFDCVLSTCFYYLGMTEMTVEKRFRGAIFGEGTQTMSNVTISSKPRCLISKEVKFTNTEGNKIPYNTMIVNTLQEAFFDRFMKMKKADHYKTILWQDREIVSDVRFFQQNHLDAIVSNHYTNDKLSIIGAKKDETLSIIVTRKIKSAQIEIPTNFGIIDQIGLQEYYGSYVYQLYCLHLPIPFPINQYEKYSEFDLAVFLGITKKQAKTIRDRIMRNGEVMDTTRISVNASMVNFATNIEIIQKDQYKAVGITPDGNCMFAAALYAYSRLPNCKLSLTIQQLREMVVKQMEEDDDTRKLLISQIMDMKKGGQFEELGEEFGHYLKSLTEEFSEQLISQTVLPKYVENMKNDKVWGGAVELGIIARILNTAIYIVTPSYCTEVNSGAMNRIVLKLENNHYDALIQPPLEVSATNINFEVWK